MPGLAGQFFQMESTLSLSTNFKTVNFRHYCVALSFKVRVRTCNNHSEKTLVRITNKGRSTGPVRIGTAFFF